MNGKIFVVKDCNSTQMRFLCPFNLIPAGSVVLLTLLDDDKFAVLHVLAVRQSVCILLYTFNRSLFICQCHNSPEFVPWGCCLVRL